MIAKKSAILSSERAGTTCPCFTGNLVGLTPNLVIVHCYLKPKNFSQENVKQNSKIEFTLSEWASNNLFFFGQTFFSKVRELGKKQLDNKTCKRKKVS